jgi:hypothetical protein
MRGVVRIHGNASRTTVFDELNVVLVTCGRHDFVSFGDECGEKPATDDAGSAGDEDLHGRTFRSTARSFSVAAAVVAFIPI